MFAFKIIVMSFKMGGCSSKKTLTLEVIRFSFHCHNFSRFTAAQLIVNKYLQTSSI